MTLALFRLGLTATYERADDRQTLLKIAWVLSSTRKLLTNWLASSQ